VGETRRGEGVLGLRRAFQLAGARTVVMSLWDVPDAETQRVMTDFYRRIKGGTGKARALQEASLAPMKARREKKVGAAHPYFWAAFVMDPSLLGEDWGLGVWSPTLMQGVIQREGAVRTANLIWAGKGYHAYEDEGPRQQ